MFMDTPVIFKNNLIYAPNYSLNMKRLLNPRDDDWRKYFRAFYRIFRRKEKLSHRPSVLITQCNIVALSSAVSMSHESWDSESYQMHGSIAFNQIIFQVNNNWPLPSVHLSCPDHQIMQMMLTMYQIKGFVFSIFHRVSERNFHFHLKAKGHKKNEPD